MRAMAVMWVRLRERLATRTCHRPALLHEELHLAQAHAMLAAGRSAHSQCSSHHAVVQRRDFLREEMGEWGGQHTIEWESSIAMNARHFIGEGAGLGWDPTRTTTHLDFGGIGRVIRDEAVKIPIRDVTRDRAGKLRHCPEILLLQMVGVTENGIVQGKICQNHMIQGNYTNNIPEHPGNVKVPQKSYRGGDGLRKEMNRNADVRDEAREGPRVALAHLEGRKEHVPPRSPHLVCSASRDRGEWRGGS